MGKDKSLFDYHGKPQRYYLYEMLETLCEKVFISCNKEQAPSIPAEYNTLVDDPEFEGIGPMAALLTAFKKHPKADFLVIGCDYPFINRHHLKKLIISGLGPIPAISYYDKLNDKYEPMIALYHNDIKNTLKTHFKSNQHSLNAILKEVDAYTINAKSPEIIRSINTIKEYKEVSELFKKFRE
jgi:molybdopterin-guanine dinucleotide biosynthesis protein A